MGRPVKQGIDCFPLDVGFFSDIKTRKISRACGSQSASILICLLCNIYRTNGYYISWNDDIAFVIAEEVGVTEDAVNDVVDKALQVGFFNQDLFDKYKILTSVGIQQRYIVATYQRKDRFLNNDYIVFHANNSVNCAKNPVSCKEKPTKKEKKKIKEIANPQEKLEERKKIFYDSLRPFVGQYPKEMIREFYDYWSEMNKSKTKMGKNQCIFCYMHISRCGCCFRHGCRNVCINC